MEGHAMSIRERSTRAAAGIGQLMGAPPDDDQAKAIANLIEREIIEAVLEESQRCVRVAQRCCSADLDIAHKIQAEIERAQTALIANLSSLR